ncbi:hypothetical protein [Noviluteimonas gilva]|uniref:Uncharacterized protein n=1 Tax=Noviluteimonas gilva TaxID=2682097 RepID=A0A7C9HNR4_9GAMM|nr:hypothetical protein [Lysobacter gilvus]MUV15497.1 hypothetical protein [Lysobacter gilvus]
MTWLKLALALMLAFCVTPASAIDHEEIRKQAHYRMDLTGWIEVDQAGAVTAHGLDQDVAKLPPSVVTRVAQAASGWRFASRTSDEMPVAARVPMNLHIEARRAPDGHVSDLRIAGAQFGEAPREERVTYAKRPGTLHMNSIKAFRGGAGGTVHLVLRVGRDGKPMQVVAEQVNLTVFDSEPAMKRWRGELGERGVRVAQHWRFTPPTVGPSASNADWTVKIPARFLSPRERAPALGEWEIYVPGPKHEIPWDTGSEVVTEGGVDLVRSSLRLLTPLDMQAPRTAVR